MKKYSVSVVGCGFGGGLSLEAIHRSDRFNLVAVTDLDEHRRDEVVQANSQVKAFATPEAMFAQCPAEVVCVSTWAGSHREITLQALQQPGLRGLLVEKPLGDTVESASELLRAVKDKRLPLAVPHGLLVAPHVVEIIRHVRDGAIGDLRLVEIQNTQWDLINAGIHWVNFFVTLVGDDPVTHVQATCDTTTRTFRDGLQVETEAITYAQTRSGVRLVMQTGDEVRVTHPETGVGFRIVGSKGLVEFRGWKPEYRLLNASNPSGQIIRIDEPKRTRHQIHLEHLATQIDTAEADYAIADASAAALEVCEAAYLSHRHRCRVALPLTEFDIPVENDWDPGRPYSGHGGGRDGRKL